MKIKKTITITLEKCPTCGHEFKPRKKIEYPVCPKCKRGYGKTT